MIGERIEALRKRKKISQAELARQLHVSLSTIKNWETDAFEPRLDNVKQMATFFSVTTDYLLEQSGRYTLAIEDLEEEDVALIHLYVRRIMRLKRQAEG